MPMRQRIGLSLVMLLISTTALAEAPKKNGSEPLIQPPSGTAAGKSRSARKGAHRRPAAHVLHAAVWQGRRWRREQGRSSAMAQSPGETAGYQPAVLAATDRPQFGRAAWYRLEGNLTASGERMDVRRATAAHRSLPLLSYARVTNLDNGRSVIVRINDRGPLSHRFIIDLSPRAAREIGMRGVAEVEVEPVAVEAARTTERVAAVQ